MANPSEVQATEATLAALQNALGSDLLACYRHGAFAPSQPRLYLEEGNILAIVSDDITLHEVRSELHPVWTALGSGLESAPMVTTWPVLERHLALAPIFAHTLSETAELISGTNLIPKMPKPSKLDTLAHYAAVTMSGSAALLPTLLSWHEANEATMSLRALAVNLFDGELPLTLSPQELFEQLQLAIGPQIAAVNGSTNDLQLSDQSPPLLEGLVSIYERDHNLILVFPDQGPDQLSKRVGSIDWVSVANRVADQYRAVRLTTPKQFRLLVQREMASDFHLNSFDHAWGVEVLAGVQATVLRVLRELALTPSEILVSTLPRAYICSNEADLAMLIHDMQNRLLNVQLKHELLCRIEGWPVDLPPSKLPDRDADIRLRLDSAVHHLEWWTDFYFEKMVDCAGDIA
jgi:hypothetical protein